MLVFGCVQMGFEDSFWVLEHFEQLPLPPKKDQLQMDQQKKKTRTPHDLELLSCFL